MNFKVITTPDKYGVYEASFMIRESSGKVLQKEKHSTLFPQGWSRQRLYDECLFALNNKVKIEGSESSFTSKTLCGIPVEMHFSNDETNIRTLYPVMSA